MFSFDPFSSKELPNYITAYHFYFSDNFVVPLPSGLVALGGGGGLMEGPLEEMLKISMKIDTLKDFWAYVVLQLLVSFFICYSVMAFPIVYSSYSI